MSAELVTMLAVGAALAGLVLVQTGAVRADLRRQGERRDALAERVARLEGVLSTLQDLLISSRDNKGAA